MEDTQLIELNRQGIIPGPDENEENFINRSEFCLQLGQTIREKLGDEVPFISEIMAAKEYLNPALRLTEELYDIAPRWIPLFFSNYRLLPWQGGCAWIFQMSADASSTISKGAFLQLRKVFCHSQNYLGLYSREELIAHELCHVGRMCFEEDRFEEILAYKISKSTFRAWLGGVAQSPVETLIFILSLCASLFVDLYTIVGGFDSRPESFLFIKLVPILLFSAALLRLVWRRRQFSKTSAHLKDLFQNKAEAILYRLTDKEIISFSKMTQEQLRVALQDKKDSDLRWRVIHKAYITPDSDL